MHLSDSVLRGLVRLGDAALAGVFVHAGCRVARDPGGPAAKVDAFTKRHFGFTSRRTPDLVRANALLMVGAGACLAVGVWPRAAAAALALSLQPTNIAGHPFWAADEVDKVSERTAFLSNLAITAGLAQRATLSRARN